jgi:outer membrane protein insertion porin family
MKVTLVLLAFILSVARLYASQSQESPKIESLEIRGNRRIPSDTIKYHIQSKPGDFLNANLIRRDVRELYSQGFFEDICVDSEEGKNGGIVLIFVVKEKPLIRSVDFVGSNSLTRSDILDKLTERKSASVKNRLMTLDV